MLLEIPYSLTVQIVLESRVEFATQPYASIFAVVTQRNGIGKYVKHFNLLYQLVLSKYVSYLTPILTLNVLGRGGYIYWYQDLAAVERMPSQVLGDETGEELHGIRPQPPTPRSYENTRRRSGTQDNPCHPTLK
jgi:hypothetical protein